VVLLTDEAVLSEKPKSYVLLVTEVSAMDLTGLIARIPMTKAASWMEIMVILLVQRIRNTVYFLKERFLVPAGATNIVPMDVIHQIRRKCRAER